MTDELQKQSEETLKARTADNSKEGDQPKSPTLADGANAAAERLEKATAEAKVERIAREELLGKERLSGRANAGQAPVEKTQGELNNEEAERRVADFQ